MGKNNLKFLDVNFTVKIHFLVLEELYKTIFDKLIDFSLKRIFKNEKKNIFDLIIISKKYMCNCIGELHQKIY